MDLTQRCVTPATLQSWSKALSVYHTMKSFGHEGVVMLRPDASMALFLFLYLHFCFHLWKPLQNRCTRFLKSLISHRVMTHERQSFFFFFFSSCMKSSLKPIHFHIEVFVFLFAYNCAPMAVAVWECSLICLLHNHRI